MTDEQIEQQIDEQFVEPSEPLQLAGRVAVVGYPNVGKSTLVNRLTGSRAAIVHAEPGVTRDRKELDCEWNGCKFVLIDTGGVDPGDPRPMARQVTEQVRVAIADADMVLFVVDAAAGISAADLELSEMLRRSQVPTMVVANKIDNYRNAAQALEFYGLGLGDPIPVSAQHGTNTGDLLDDLVTRLTEIGTRFERRTDDRVTVAILGRPNVGKSTIVNAMLGSDRVIVSDVSGTTRDAIDTQFEFEGRRIILIDTAGIRRKRGRDDDAVEYYSELRSLQAAERADVALIVVDAAQGLTESDISIADKARQNQCATLVALNKWDIQEIDLLDVTATMQQKLRQRPEVVTTSSVTGRNIAKLLGKVVELFDRYNKTIGTGELNSTLKEIVKAVPPPSSRGRRLNIMYATQVQAGPMRIRIYVNDRRHVTRSYTFYLENQLRERFDLNGCPIIIDFVSRA